MAMKVEKSVKFGFRESYETDTDPKMGHVTSLRPSLEVPVKKAMPAGSLQLSHRTVNSVGSDGEESDEGDRPVMPMVSQKSEMWQDGNLPPEQVRAAQQLAQKVALKRR